MALAFQEGWLSLWGDWLKTGVHMCACVYAHACVCAHVHVFMWLRLVLKAWQGWGKAVSCSQLVLPALHFSVSSQLPSSNHRCLAADLDQCGWGLS